MATTSSTISGFREQIKGTLTSSSPPYTSHIKPTNTEIANALHLFPSLVQPHAARHAGTNTYLYIPPSSAFDITVLSITLPTPTPTPSPSKKRAREAQAQTQQADRGWQAYLTYSTPAGFKRAAQGAASDTVEGALESLLETTGRALAGKVLDVFNGEGFGNWQAYGGGFVDEEVSVGAQSG